VWLLHAPSLRRRTSSRTASASAALCAASSSFSNATSLATRSADGITVTDHSDHTACGRPPCQMHTVVVCMYGVVHTCTRHSTV
jgi:hypothetical protein